MKKGLHENAIKEAMFDFRRRAVGAGLDPHSSLYVERELSLMTGLNELMFPRPTITSLWRCDYCTSAHSPDKYSCSQCGAPR